MKFSIPNVRGRLRAAREYPRRRLRWRV